MKDTYLWNPTIRKFVELPRSHVTYGSHKGFEHEIGFGYDVKKNDFKVIRIVETDKMSSPRVPLEVQIYSLNGGNWRNVSHLASAIKCQVYDWSPQAYLNESAHWISKIPTPIIVSFHFGQESFRCFEVPNCPLDLNIWSVVIEGSLSLVGWCNDRCIIWIMNEYGHSSSLKVWFIIDLQHDIERVFGFRNKSRLLLQTQRKLFYFDHPNGKREAYAHADVTLLRGVLLKLYRDGRRSISISLSIPIIHIYDHTTARKDPCFQGRVNNSHRRKKFWCCEGYVESLALIGKSTVAHAANHSQTKEEGMKSSTKNIPGNTSIHLSAPANT